MMDDSVLKKAAEKYGTPLYVYDKAIIDRQCDAFKKAFKGLPWEFGIRYAFKANTNPEILSIIRSHGFGGDIVSIGELEAGLNAGFKPKDLVYTSNSKSREELARALAAGVCITHGNIMECEILNEIAKERGVVANVAFRVNPDVDAKTHPKISTGLKGSKFGLHFERNLAFNAFKFAKDLENINPVGLHCHIGSQITDMSGFADAAGKLIDFAQKLDKELGVRLDFLDFGGGLGVSYDGRPVVGVEEFAGEYKKILADEGGKLSYRPNAFFEPGRYLVAESGVLLTKVNSIKETPYKKFVNVDSGFNTLVRPVMYDAYHPVRVVGKTGGDITYDIAGNLCESGDILAKERNLPKVEVNDIIEIGLAGAYGYSMSSNYNSKPKPAEVLVDGGKIKLIRKRQDLRDVI
ncbi:MAG TPA: diaminopimelate decarboxylase [Candidatus Altiarchaeales archaeon]|nr:diaminopimelate decarboxylase [Candidatus Altiarchaeales archaeon]